MRGITMPGNVEYTLIIQLRVCGTIFSPWPASGCLSKKFCLVKPTETGINEAALESFERWLLAEINTLTSLNAER